MRRAIKYAFFGLVVAVAVCAPRATHLRGHTGEHPWAVFSPDARYIASVSESDHTVRIWDGVTREQLAVIPDGDFSCVAFSPNNKLLALGGKKGLVTIWKTSNGAEVCRLVGHAGDVWQVCGLTGRTGDIEAVAFGPDNSTVAVGSRDGVVRVWDLATTKEVLTIQTHHRFLTELVYSPDGKFLASGGSPGGGKEVRLWDAKTGQERWSAKKPGGMGWVNRLCFSPGGETLCASYRDGFSLWDVTTGHERDCEQPKWLDEDDIYVDVVAFSPDGRALAAGHEKTIGLWDVGSGKNTARFPKDDDHHLLRFPDRFLLRPDMPDLDPNIKAAAFRPNGDLMAVGSQVCTTTVVMWRVTSVPLKK